MEWCCVCVCACIFVRVCVACISLFLEIKEQSGVGNTTCMCVYVLAFDSECTECIWLLLYTVCIVLNCVELYFCVHGDKVLRSAILLTKYCFLFYI